MTIKRPILRDAARDILCCRNVDEIHERLKSMMHTVSQELMDLKGDGSPAYKQALEDMRIVIKTIGC